MYLLEELRLSSMTQNRYINNVYNLSTSTTSLAYILSFCFQSGQKLIPNLSCKGNDDDSDDIYASKTSRKNTEISQGSENSETKWALGERFHK